MPRRRCVGCGRIAPKAELLRIAAQPNRVAGARPLAVPDPAARMDGRGAYLCRSPGGGADPGCTALGMRRGGFARALRAPVSLDPKLVESTRP